MKNKEINKKGLAMQVVLPKEVNAQLDDGMLILKGSKGEVSRDFSDKKIKIENKDGVISLRAVKFSKRNKKLIKSYAAHIRNMIKGSLEGHRYTLKICSGHFPMNVSVNGSQFTIKNFLGEKIPRILELKEGAKVKVEGDLVTVESSSKEIAGQISADIEQLTRRTGYDTRIFQDGIHIITKDGKELR